MTAGQGSRDERGWEKEQGPAVSKSYLVFVCALFAAWLSFLLYFAIQGWFGALRK